MLIHIALNRVCKLEVRSFLFLLFYSFVSVIAGIAPNLYHSSTLSHAQESTITCFYWFVYTLSVTLLLYLMCKNQRLPAFTGSSTLILFVFFSPSSHVFLFGSFIFLLSFPTQVSLSSLLTIFCPSSLPLLSLHF